MMNILRGIVLLLLLGYISSVIGTPTLRNLGFKEPADYFPIPANAYPFQPNQANGLTITELEDGIFFVSDTAYTFCIIDIGKTLVVVDAPPTVNQERLINATLTITKKKKKVSHFIYSHAHVDHVGLASAFKSKHTKFIAHELTAQLLKRNPDAPKPTIILTDDESRLTLGNKNFRFYYKGNSHAEGNILIWIPKSKVLINIDIVFPQWAPFYALGVTQDAIRYIKQYEFILSFPFNHFITGHLGRAATRDDVVLGQTFMNDMKSIVTTGFSVFNNITAYYAKFGGNNTLAVNHWAVLHNWEADMASYCADNIIAKYQNVMAGIDVYSWSNCWILREHLALFTPLD
jgi:glyoxylase-like metal-dependent hydrolase (beta-lactamase superfamily II)